jgi:hypothetical protein
LVVSQFGHWTGSLGCSAPKPPGFIALWPKASGIESLSRIAKFPGHPSGLLSGESEKSKPLQSGMLDLLLTNSADEQKSKGCFVLDVERQMEYDHRVSEMQYFSEFRLGLAQNGGESGHRNSYD